ncbi:hypothetical protein TrVE_jg3679 [Triparma verrucosa]|uniref:Uncharacterized protein n=1 Tax=Triparma verrucosa TaxID=1606542 RepID=A0A9W7KWT2_9STRA|nr:hypothetical protein TrVE_jg3679 [Triparma verrucosa]
MGGCVVEVQVEDDVPDVMLESFLINFLRHVESSPSEVSVNSDSEPKEYGDLIQGTGNDLNSVSHVTMELKIGEEYVEERGKSTLGGFRNSFTALH